MIDAGRPVTRTLRDQSRILVRRHRAAICCTLLALPIGVAAHENEPHAWSEVWRIWNDDWWLWTLVLAAGAAYALGVWRLWREARHGAGITPVRVIAFAAGWTATAFALLSPLDPLGGQLFSAHMIQHEVLMLIAAPLLVAGRPIGAFLWALPRGWRRGAWSMCNASGVQARVRWLSRPIVAWSVHATALWLWHLPALFDASVRNELVHTAQHVSFFGTALLFWWAIMRPGVGVATLGAAALYVLTTAMHTSILGALLTFSSVLWYQVYAQTAPTWGLTAIEDQQIGGLVMWVPAGTVYLGLALLFLHVWLRAMGRRATDLANDAAYPSPRLQGPQRQPAGD